MILRLAACLLLAALGSACSPIPLPPEAPKKLDTFIDRTSSYADNGFRVVVVSDFEQTDVRMEIRYTVGSGQDPAGGAGLAHVVEHLLYEVPVSDEQDADTYGSALSRLGYYWNAYTTQDATSYVSVFAKEDLAEVFALEMVRAKRGCRGLTEENFLRAREIVRNEARERSIGEIGQIVDALEEFLYVDGHPYRSNTLGTDTSISSLTVQDACAFIKQHYHPKNTIIVVSGPIRQNELEGITRRWFPSFPTTTPASAPFPEFSFRTTRERTTRLDVGTPYLFALWQLDPRETNEHDLQRQVHYALAEELEKLVKKTAWGTNAGTFIMGGANAPALVAAVELRGMDNLEEAKVLIGKATAALLKREGDFSFADLENRLVVQRYEDLSARTQLLADYEQHRNQSFVRDRIGRRVETSSSSLHQTATKLFAAHTERFLIIDPKASAAERKVATFQFRAGSPKHESLLEPDAATIEQAILPLGLPESLGEKQAFRRYRLPNGLQLLFWVRPELPLVYGRLVVPVGSAQVPPRWAGLSKLLAGEDDYDVTVFSRTSLAKNAHSLVYTLAHSFAATKRILSRRQLDSLRRSLEREASKKASDYALRLSQAIYGESHPYTRTRLRLNSLDALTEKAARSWAHQARSVNGATLVLAGRFDPQLMYLQALYHFRDAPTHSLEEFAYPTAPLPTSDAIVTMVDEEQASLSISLVYRGGRGVDSTQPARDILADILRDRLQRLREEQALTYGMSARYVPERGNGLWVISGDVDAARSEQAMGFLRASIATLRDNPESYIEQFAKARQQRMNRVGTQKISAAVAADRLTYLIRYDLEDDYFENYIRALAQTTPADVQRLLESEFKTANRVLGLVGPAKAIAAAKAALAH